MSNKCHTISAPIFHQSLTFFANNPIFRSIHVCNPYLTQILHLGHKIVVQDNETAVEPLKICDALWISIELLRRKSFTTFDDDERKPQEKRCHKSRTKVTKG